MAEGSAREDRWPDEQRERVKVLLAAVWRGGQREMARSLGVSQGLVSKVVNGLQAPGRKLLAALAAHPAVNDEWVWRGVGDPLLPPNQGSLPVADWVLPGPPADHPHLLAGLRHPVAAAFDRPTRYWLSVGEALPILREPALSLAAGDLLLLEADSEWTARPDLTDGRVCGVRLGGADGAEYHLGRVLLLRRGLVVRLFGGVTAPAPAPPAISSPPRAGEATRRIRRKIRPLERQAENARLREQAEERLRAEAAAGLPIGREDIVAVQVYLVRPELAPL